MFNVPTARRSKYEAVDSCRTPDGSDAWARFKAAGNAQLKRAGALPAGAEQALAAVGGGVIRLRGPPCIFQW